MTEAGKGKLFKDVVEAIERSGHGLCVLRGYRDYPEHIGPDIDAIFDDPAQLPRVLAEQGVATAVQVFEHETTFYYLYRWDEGKPVFITLDLSGDYGYRGRIFFRGDEFLKSSRPFKFFKVPAAELEFASYFLRKASQSSLGERQGRRLSELYRESPEGSVRQLSRFFPQEDAVLISEAAESGEWEPVRRDMQRLRRTMLRGMDREHPLRPLAYWLGAFGRRVRRITQPPGLMITFLGTDGSGKSTVMERVERDLGPAFWEKKQYHKRPLSSPFRWVKKYGLRPPKTEKNKEGGGDPATGFNPHALRSRGAAYSLTKLGFWWADFLLLGYIGEVLPRLMRPSLLLFDRYYQDLLVDPRRYHYGGPLWMARLVGRFVPQPHLIILLDAPPEVLRSRKQELPLEEVTRQREAYLNLVRPLSNGHVVDTSRPIEEAVAEVEEIILDYMARRTARRSGFHSPAR